MIDMSSNVSDRVRRLLDDVEPHLDSIEDSDDESMAESVTDSDIGELVEEAGAVIADTEGEELLEALGFGDTDGIPSSIPVAIATGDEEPVKNLRALLLLSNLPVEEDDEETLHDRIQELRESIGNLDWEGMDEGTDSEPDSSADESGGGQIRSAMESAIGDLREEVGNFGELSETVSDAVGTEDSESADAADDDEEDDDGAEDDGLLGGDDDASKRSGFLSTMPRQPRADMKALRRHSTMPER